MVQKDVIQGRPGNAHRFQAVIGGDLGNQLADPGFGVGYLKADLGRPGTGDEKATPLKKVVRL